MHMQCIYLIFQFREVCLKIVIIEVRSQFNQRIVMTRVRHASTNQVLAYANSSKVYSLLNSGLEKEN